MKEDERLALRRWAFGRRVLEIGSYEGLSTSQLGITADSIDAVDTFDGRGTPEPRDTFEAFKATVTACGITDKVKAHRGLTTKVLPRLEPQSFDLAFIDASHDYANVKQDADLARPLLKPDGLLAFHDYNDVHPGVQRVVDDLIDGGARLVEHVNTLALLSFAPAPESKPLHLFIALPHRNRQPDPKTLARIAEHAIAEQRRCKVTVRMSGHSVLTLNFNGLLALALNEVVADGCTHFAMLHDDVFPDAGWATTLLGELDTYALDMVSAVVPIKNDKGLSSTGTDTVGDPWAVRRISMREIFTLPKTFTAADVPWRQCEAPLLVNSGCWVMKLDQPWIQGLAFRQTDRLAYDVVKKRYFPQSISEDWDWSRQMHGRGARIGATRKVGLIHERAEYHNRAPWGAWETDEDYAQYLEEVKAADEHTAKDDPYAGHVADCKDAEETIEQRELVAA